jgi:ATP-dependent RNA helicase RhlE
MIFKELGIIEPILKALTDEGYTKPTPIQEEAIPQLLAGKDLLGCAQTGTGKTAAFAIPLLQNIYNSEKGSKGAKYIKGLILAPTRELAIQIGENVTSYGRYMEIKNTEIFGGVSQNPQTRAIKAGVDILIATPGRLIDLINQGFIDLSSVNYLILDEADRMLDMGMLNDVKKIISKLPKARQNMLFSATMPNEIMKLVNSILKNPVRIEVTPVSSTIDTITQGLYHVSKKHKVNLLIDILKDKSIESLLVFSRTKHGANKITNQLIKVGIEAQAIHGNKSQNARQLALNNFKEGKTRVLVATDIAARGIDVDDLSYVINYDLPEVPETYVHRIGRTGRAGQSGIALSFCDYEERDYLKSIEKLIGKNIPLKEGNPYDIRLNSIPMQDKEVVTKSSASKKSNKSWYSNRRKNK